MTAPGAVDRGWVPPPQILRSGEPVCDDICYVPEFLNDATRARYSALATQTTWAQESIPMFGRSVAVPRRCAWYGDAGVTYGYSRQLHRASGWSATTAALRDDLLQRLGIRFNFVLLNFYRNGTDCIGWHSDNELDLGENPCIASLSFGAPRRFCLRARDDVKRRVQILLDPGSLLLMWGRSQHDWVHSLPRARDCHAPRVNLTFRLVRIPA